MTHIPFDEPDLVFVTAPRRGVFRLLAGAALGVVVLVGLASCGGGEDENGDDED